jgi:hypothetical protein
VSPLFPDEATRYDASLVGSWHDTAGKESAVITADPPNGYKIVYTEDDGKAGRFVGRLGVVGSVRVLDLYPDDPPEELSGTYRSLLLPLHTPVVIDSVGPVLRFRILDPDSIKAYLTKNPRSIASVKRGDTFVLTAPTPDVQRFLATLIQRRGFLGEQNVWRRQPP